VGVIPGEVKCAFMSSDQSHRVVVPSRSVPLIEHAAWRPLSRRVGNSKETADDSDRTRTHVIPWFDQSLSGTFFILHLDL
jgi:hypothetical protein